MDLSIIIVNYNTKDLTLECIDSIFKNPPRTKIEVIVVDNGSSDGSNKALKKDRRIKYIESSQNLGFAKGNNLGIKSAAGRYILLLNSDTIVKKGAIDRLYNFAVKTRDAGVVGARLLNIDGSVQSSVSYFPTLGRAIQEYWFGKKGNFELYAPKVDEPLEVESLVGAAFLITPEALNRVGRLNEKYFMYFEDLDYCRAVKNNGLKVYYLPEAEIVHYHGASGRKIVKEAFQWRRLIPSSKIYHGFLIHSLISFVLWSGQKVNRLLGK